MFQLECVDDEVGLFIVRTAVLRVNQRSSFYVIDEKTSISSKKTDLWQKRKAVPVQAFTT